MKKISPSHGPGPRSVRAEAWQTLWKWCCDNGMAVVATKPRLQNVIDWIQELIRGQAPLTDCQSAV